jgi:hypothetical protein
MEQIASVIIKKTTCYINNRDIRRGGERERERKTKKTKRN